ncbi:hypothetical protein ACI7YT_12565 [Microbacterium sp. M]|uniref:hypothetical protein n=1 Tax=Microbacterium sp. M TaxID=3377125 RepID=UPI003867F4F4
MTHAALTPETLPRHVQIQEQCRKAAEECDRKALHALTGRESKSLRRLARDYRLRALMAAYSISEADT